MAKFAKYHIKGVQEKEIATNFEPSIIITETEKQLYGYHDIGMFTICGMKHSNAGKVHYLYKAL